MGNPLFAKTIGKFIVSVLSLTWSPLEEIRAVVRKRRGYRTGEGWLTTGGFPVSIE
jgi:hypothetical protein